MAASVIWPFCAAARRHGAELYDAYIYIYIYRERERGCNLACIHRDSDAKDFASAWCQMLGCRTAVVSRLQVGAIEQFEPGHGHGSSHGETRITRLAYFEGAGLPRVLQKPVLFQGLEYVEGASGSRRTLALQAYVGRGRSEDGSRHVIPCRRSLPSPLAPSCRVRAVGGARVGRVWELCAVGRL